MSAPFSKQQASVANEWVGGTTLATVHCHPAGSSQPSPVLGDSSHSSGAPMATAAWVNHFFPSLSNAIGAPVRLFRSALTFQQAQNRGNQCQVATGGLRFGSRGCSIPTPLGARSAPSSTLHPPCQAARLLLIGEWSSRCSGLSWGWC